MNDDTNENYKHMFYCLKDLLTLDKRFGANEASTLTIYQRNYAYLDAEDVIYFINKLRDTLGNPKGISFHYRML